MKTLLVLNTKDKTCRTLKPSNPRPCCTPNPSSSSPIAEYAARHNISRRTVDRYVKCGRLETTKQHGRTMILDKPLKPQPSDTGQGRTDTDCQLVLSQTDWMHLGYLKARSKSKTIWQTYAIVLTILFVSLLLASLWLFTQWRFLTETIVRP